MVFSTKNRIPLITKNLQPDLHGYIGGVVRGEGGILLEIGGMSDHVHLLARFKPSKPVSEMLNRIKAKSSKWANEQKRRLRQFGWQEGYAAFSVSESQVPRVRKYIQQQESHHRQRSFQEELWALLEKHRVEYDERYVWT